MNPRYSLLKVSYSVNFVGNYLYSKVSRCPSSLPYSIETTSLLIIVRFLLYFFFLLYKVRFKDFYVHRDTWLLGPQYRTGYRPETKRPILEPRDTWNFPSTSTSDEPTTPRVLSEFLTPSSPYSRERRCLYSWTILRLFSVIFL